MSATSSKLKNPNDSVMNQRVIKLAWPIFLQLLLGISLGYVDTIMPVALDIMLKARVRKPRIWFALPIAPTAVSL